MNSMSECSKAQLVAGCRVVAKYNNSVGFLLVLIKELNLTLKKPSIVLQKYQIKQNKTSNMYRIILRFSPSLFRSEAYLTFFTIWPLYLNFSVC